MGKQSLGSCYILVTCYNLLSKYGEFKKINSIPHNVVTLGLFFPPKKPFYLSQWFFWGFKDAKIHQKQKHRFQLSFQTSKKCNTKQ